MQCQLIVMATHILAAISLVDHAVLLFISVMLLFAGRLWLHVAMAKPTHQLSGIAVTPMHHVFRYAWLLFA